VPFILVCSPQASPFGLVLSSIIVGFCFWLGNIYWMGYVTVAGWIAFCAYTGLLWPILALSIRYCRKKKLPLFIAVPLLVVGAERAQGLFLGGFYWHFLAHSQYANTSIVQIADIFGAAGVSFLVAMVNGLLAEMIICLAPGTWYEGKLITRANLAKVTIVIAAVAATIVYGRWRINQSSKTVEEGPLVAAVQSNVPQSVKKSFAAERQIFEDLLEQSRQIKRTGAQLIAWPETMVQAILEPDLLRLIDSEHTYNLFDTGLKRHAKNNAYLLVGAYGGTAQIQENFDIRIAHKYNSAFLYRPDGTKDEKRYGKIHLVPFGEVLPFENIPLIRDLLIKMSPYDFDYTLDAGTEYTIFEMAGDNSPRTYRFSVMICYEDAVPAMARRFAMDEEGDKRIDWLVNISNDGWFVKFKAGRVVASTELAQHTAICTFRAVENRLAVLRSVNTGISCIIDTLGRIRDGYQAGNLPKEAMARQGVQGWFADTIPLDSRTTIFSRYSGWLDFCCQACIIIIVFAQVFEKLVLECLHRPEREE